MRYSLLLLCVACGTPRAEAPAHVAIISQGATTVPSAVMAAQKSILRTPSTHIRLAADGSVRELSVTSPLAADTPEAMARAALTHYASALGELPTLALDRVVDDGVALHVRFFEVAGATLVAGRSVDVHIARTGDGFALQRIAGSLGPVPMPAAAAGGDVQNEGMAKIRALQIAGQPEQNWQLTVTDVVQDFGTGPRLIHRVWLRGDTAEREIDLDAYTGELLGKTDHSENGNVQALIYPINNSRGDRTLIPLEHLQVGASATDANGAFSGDSLTLDGLSGPLFSVANGAGPVIAYSGTGTIALTSSDPHLGELSAFHWMGAAHDFFASTYDFHALDSTPIHATVHYGNCLFNAFATGTAQLVFGDACGLYDYAQSSDYVLHEYTHLVTNAISDIDYGIYNEAGAFSEGQSDYFACTQTEDATWGENPFGIAQRFCDNDYIYQRDYTGEAHNGGQLYAGAMWDLRKQYGRELADAIAFYLLYHVPKEAQLLDVRDAAIAADAQHFAGAHHDAIIAAFARHGIDDTPLVFVTSSNIGQPVSTSTAITFGAHAQGFDNTTVRYHWIFGVGTATDGDAVVHTFSSKPYTAELRVTDAAGHEQSVSVQLAGCRQTGPASAALWMLTLAIVVRRRRISP